MATASSFHRSQASNIALLRPSLRHHTCLMSTMVNLVFARSSNPPCRTKIGNESTLASLPYLSTGLRYSTTYRTQTILPGRLAVALRIATPGDSIDCLDWTCSTQSAGSAEEDHNDGGQAGHCTVALAPSFGERRLTCNIVVVLLHTVNPIVHECSVFIS